MGYFFKSNSYTSRVYKHINLPVYESEEFDFFRCVELKFDFYGKTVNELHSGNLRYGEGRYSALFPGKKISYWANLPSVSRAEIKKHGAGNNIITFWAYDDFTSTVPILNNRDPLRIIDGRLCGIQEIIDKLDAGEQLTKGEKGLIENVMREDPDCLVYDSHAKKGGENYIFLEKGFKKLSLREVRIRLGDKPGKNTQRISCATTSDYIPSIERYGCTFNPIAKVGYDKGYLESDEYMRMKKNYDKHHGR